MKIAKAVVDNVLKIEKKYVLDKDTFENLFIYNHGDEFFSTLESDEEHYYLPANAIAKLEIEELTDLRIREYIEPPLSFSGELRSEQLEAVKQFFPNGLEGRGLHSGLLQASPGFGKTYCACSLIASASMTTLVLVHTKLLFYQWIEELKKLVPGQDIGMIGDGKYSLKPITVAIYLSANNNIEKIKNSFSLVIVDEAHRCPTDTFSFTINNINARYKIAVTATPYRKDGHHVVFEDYFTSRKVEAFDTRKLPTPSFQIIKTGIAFNVININRDWARKLTQIGENPKYIDFIAKIAVDKIAEGRCLLIQGERVSMLKALAAKIPKSKVLVGETQQADRDLILNQAGKEVSAILTTKIFDEGISCHRLDTILLTCPSNNPIKLEQRIGRIVRLHPDKKEPLILDFWFIGHIVNSQQTKRLQWYLAKGYKSDNTV